jgi:copper transporter 1
MSSTNTTQASVLMIPFFHLTRGDYLLFKAWRPTSGGALAGACIGVFLFAIFERWVHAISPVLIHHLVQRYRSTFFCCKSSPASYCTFRKSRSYAKPSKDRTPSPQRSSKSSDSISINEKRRLPPRMTPPFIAAVDIPRGMIYAFQRLLGFALMLAIM